MASLTGQFLRSELGRTREGGPRPARGGGDAPSRQGRGTPPSRVRLCERTYPPEGGERRSPKGIVRSYLNKTRKGSVFNCVELLTNELRPASFASA